MDDLSLTEGMRRRMLITYAVISQEMMGTTDILSGLLPFFEPILDQRKGQIFDRTEFIGEVARYTHWRLTTDIADQIIYRMAKAKWLTREVEEKDAVIYRITIPEHRDTPSKVGEIEQLHKLALEFRNFLGSLPGHMDEGLEEETATEMLLEWLVEAFSEPGQEVSPVEETEDEDPLPASHRMPRSKQYLCARFAMWLSEKDPTLARFLTEIGGAVMLTEVILHFRHPEGGDRKRLNLTVFVDCPIIMDYLGLSGDILKESASYTIEKFRSMGCNIACFAHSRDEIRDILMAITHAPQSSRFGPTAEALRRKEISEQDLAVVLASLDRKLKDVGIQVVTTMVGQLSSTSDYFPDELIPEIAVKLAQSDIEYSSTGRFGYAARDERDAKSVAIVMRKRQGHRTSSLFDSRVIMLSQNRRLCSVGRNVAIEHDLLGEWDIGPIVHRSDAAGALFLVMGSDEREKVTRSELLSVCIRMIRLRPKIVESVKQQLESLQSNLSSDDLDALLMEPRCAIALMDATIGADRIVDRSNVEEVIECVKRSVNEEDRRKYDKALKTQKDASDQQLNEVKQGLEEKIEELEQAITKQTERHDDLMEELRVAHRGRERTLKRIFGHFATRLRYERIGFRIILIFVMVSVTALGIKLLGSDWDIFYQVAGGLVAVVVEAAGLFGWHIPRLFDNWRLEALTRQFNAAIIEERLEDVSKYFDMNIERESIVQNAPVPYLESF